MIRSSYKIKKVAVIFSWRDMTEEEKARVKEMLVTLAPKASAEDPIMDQALRDADHYGVHFVVKRMLGLEKRMEKRDAVRPAFSSAEDVLKAADDVAPDVLENQTIKTYCLGLLRTMSVEQPEAALELLHKLAVMQQTIELRRIRIRLCSR